MGDKLVRALLAKIVMGEAIEDKQMRGLCGWSTGTE
jgi:hypothetical protein